MLKYTLDIESASLWLRTTPTEFALSQPFYVTEAGVFYARAGFNTQRSFKDSWWIVYTFSGKGILQTDNESVTLQEGTALLLNCRQAHSYRTDPECKHWHHYWIHASGMGVKAIEPVLCPSRHLHPIAVSGVIRDRFDRVLEVMQQENAGAALEMGLMVHRILTRMAHAVLYVKGDVCGQNTSTLEKNRKLMEQAAERIRAHAAEPLDLSELLQNAHMSRSYFMAQFRHYLGTTPYQYMLSIRMTQAKELLEMSDYSIETIAEKTGFQDVSTFSNRFSRIIGISPTKFREDALKIKEN